MALLPFSELAGVVGLVLSSQLLVVLQRGSYSGFEALDFGGAAFEEAVEEAGLVGVEGSLGITAAIAVCEWFKLQAATRSATIAVLITMHEPGQYFWDVALERAGGVIMGCAIGVAITYVFHHHAIERLKRAAKQG